MTAFKQEVLTREQEIHEGMWVEENHKRRYVVAIPLREMNGRQEKSRWLHVFWDQPQENHLFGVILRDSHYMPWFLPGDILVVHSTAQLKPGTWCVTKHGRSYGIGRIGERQRVLDVHTLLPPIGDSAPVIGIIVGLQRHFEFHSP